MNNIDIIKEKLSLEERLCQLAEEAAELSQAALKLRRTFDTKNPTPVPPGEAYENLVEEVADVVLCLKTIGIEPTDINVVEIMERKEARWISRIQNAPTVRGGYIGI